MLDVSPGRFAQNWFNSTSTLYASRASISLSTVMHFSFCTYNRPIVMFESASSMDLVSGLLLLLLLAFLLRDVTDDCTSALRRCCICIYVIVAISNLILNDIIYTGISVACRWHSNLGPVVCLCIVSLSHACLIHRSATT